MKTFHFVIAIIAFGFLFIGCSELPVEPTDQIGSLDKQGPVVHSVEGAGLIFYEGKNLGARYTAHEFADGTFDGEYEINGANATGDPTFKWNGDVLSFLVYENAGEYSGEMAVFFGQEKTGLYAGWYDVFFAIDNGKPGQTSDPDQVNFYVVSLESLTATAAGMTIEEWSNLSPEVLISYLGTLDCDHGNITVK